MRQWSEYEAQQRSAINLPKAEYLECVKCKSDWMEKVSAGRFDKNKLTTIGQEPVVEMSFTILRCVRCGELHEPPINRGFSHPDSDKYDDLLDTLKEDPAEETKE